MGGGAGFEALAQAGVQNAEREAALKDEQRKITLKTLQEDAETPADKLAAIQAVYHKDPGVLKQHVENMTRKLMGKPTKPVVTPDQAEQGRVAPLAARGKTPEQQQMDAYQKQLDIANKGRLDVAQKEAQQKQQQAFALIDQTITDPDQNKAAKEDYARKQAGILASFKNIPGAGGQPYKTPNGQWVRPVQQVDGSIVEQPMPAGWTPPAPKAQPKAGTSHGKNVFATLTPQGWVDAGTGKPLDDFRPAPSYAQMAPSLRAVQVVDPNDPTSTVYESIPEALKTHAHGTQGIDYKLQMPTGQERGRADLASSAREQLGDMTDILRSRTDLFGPGPGHVTNFKRWVGSQDPDAQKFAAAARIAADHLAGVFGGRSQAALEAIYDVIGKNTTNPAAAIAGIEQMDRAAANIQAKGRSPAPKASGRKVGEKKKFPNGKTGVWDGQGWVAQ